MKSNSTTKKGMKVKLRTKIILPTIIILLLSTVFSIFTANQKMDILVKSNAKMSLNQLTDSIFLYLREAMNTGDVKIIERAEMNIRKDIEGIEKFTVHKSKKVIELFNPQAHFTTDKEVLNVFYMKKQKIIDKIENGKHIFRSIKPMIANKDCVVCHVNQKEGEIVGIVDLTFNLEKSDEIIDSALKSLIVQGVGSLLVLILFIMFVIRKATKPIEALHNGLEMFFRFLNKKESNIKHIHLTTNDEIGELIDSVNENIDITTKALIQDAQVINEAKEICKKASLGDFDVKIKTEGKSFEINELRELINQLINSIGYNINRIVKVLSAYDNNDYTVRINAKGRTIGAMKVAFDKVDALGNTLSNNAKANFQNGLKLEKDANRLEQALSNIQKYLTEQSVELKDSVKELENITKLVRQTTQNAIAMAEHSQNVKKSVTIGQDLANKTSEKMEEIAKQVGLINDAIAVIDQIASQTNILSLNASIEAATTGKAGRSFAVVAQEVRNLANRSAKAAKEIKNLVGNATSETQEGKQIAEEMKDGYGKLKEYTNSTIKLIEEVTESSKFQQQKIEKINQNINSINTQGVENMKMSQEALKVAVTTRELADAITKEAKTKKFNP